MPDFDPGSRSRLTDRDMGRFPSDSLFDHLGRAVCRAGCLPRKELYESWQVARRARRRLKGGKVWDLAAGHGLLAHMMLLLDRGSTGAVSVDPHPPASAAALHEALSEEWPRLRDQVRYQATPLDLASPAPGDVVVSAHACGNLTDDVLRVAIAARANVAVLPCCHDHRHGEDGGLSGWIDTSLAIDVARAGRLSATGYRVHTQRIDEAITPKNRLLLGWLES